MPSNPDLINVDPYYDDYDPSKHFLRVMFRPGYAVQARELTQAQTILQNQIESFGSHVFKDGSIVSESQVVLNPAQFVRVSGLTGYAGVSISDFEGITAAVSAKNTIKVLSTLGSLSGSNVDTSSIFVFSEYLSGSTGFAIGDTISANYSGTTIYATVTGGTATFDAGATHSPAFGSASLVGIDEGTRYVRGFFVGHDSQSVVPYNVTGSGSSTYRQFNNLNSTIKLTATDTIVTSTDDSSLNDPAFGSYNFAAPGADRYRIDLTLEHAPLSLTAEYTLINIKDGEASFKSAYPEYNVLAETLARRTYDESGNYTVQDFPVSLEEHPTDDSKLQIKIGKGKAYIFGAEFINTTNQVIDVDKARTVKLLEDQSVPIVVGSQLNLQFNSGGTAAGLTAIDFSKGPKFLISTGTSGAYSGMGYLRLQNFNPFDSGYVGNAYDITLSAGLGLTSAKRLFLPGYTASNQHIFELSDTSPALVNSNYSSLVFPLSNEINGFAVTGNYGNWTMNIEKSCTAQLSVGVNTFNIDTQFGLPNYPSFVEFSNVNDFKVFSVTGASVTGTAAFGANTRIINFTTGSTGTVNVFAKFLVSSGYAAGEEFKRAKQSQTVSETVQMRSDSIEEYAYLNGAVDAYRILAITGQYGSGGATAMTSLFDLDTGMRDNIYDWSRIVVKPEYYGLGITGVSVTYKKFARITSSATPVAYNDGPFTAKSYAGISYDEIPVYAPTERGGKPFSLAGAFDFRPDRITPGSFTGTDVPSDYGTNKTTFPTDISIDGVDWYYYVPRTDKVVLGKDQQFRVIQGIETDQAPAPPDAADAMTLATIFYQPYTKSPQDTIQSFAKNTRYTMRDIGKLDQRIDRLEFYTAMTLAEKDAASLEITDPNGLNRFKNGMFVDSFESRSNSDYFSTENLCAIDPERREVRPRFQTQYVDYGLTGTPSGLVTTADGLLMLDYTETALIEQNLSSKAVNVNPFNVSSYNGSLTISPSSDDWIDTTTRPAVLVNLQGENDGIADGTSVDFGTVWNNWETNWTGKLTGVTDWSESKSRKHSVVDPSDGRMKQQVTRERFAIQETSQTRSGQRNILQSETVTKNIGERIVDVSIVPFMRANTLTITAKGLRPGVRVYPFFDGTDVSSYVSPSTLTPDAAGNLTCTFSLPAGIFRTGEKMFRLIDDSGNVAANASSVAEEFYRAQGLLKTEEGTIVSTRGVTIRRESVLEERVFNNIVTDTVVKYVDPVAQTFYVDPLVYPNGVFVSSLDLYFATKASGLPVYIQLRSVVNGYPSSSNIIPFSEVYMEPSAVTVSEDATDATNFEFSSPVFLLPGEYAITVLSNSDEYTLWVSEVGQDDVTTGSKITSQPYAGSFFKSQNSSTWTAEQALDLKFKLNRCLFTESTGTAEFTYTESSANIPSALTSLCGVNVYRSNCTSITPAKTSIECSTEIGSETLVTQNNQNFVVPTKIAVSDGTDFIATYTLTSTDTAVSPVLDSDRISGLYIFNIVKKVSDVYKDTYESLSSTKGITFTDRLSSVRYITKKINLQQGFESTNLDVYLTTRLPYDSDLRVYMKTQGPNDNTSFDRIPYEKMSIHPDYQIQYGSATGSSQYVSNNDNDYVDLRFTRGLSSAYITSGLTGQDEFRSFQVKIVMFGNNSNSVVPAVKDMKVIAT